MFFVSLVFIQIKSCLQGHWRPFHFFDLFIISIKNLACTLLSSSLCTNGTLLSLVEQTTSTPTVGTSLGVVGTEERTFLLPSRVCEGLDGHGNKDKMVIPAHLLPVHPFLDLFNTYWASAVSGDASDTQKKWKTSRHSPHPWGSSISTRNSNVPHEYQGRGGQKLSVARTAWNEGGEGGQFQVAEEKRQASAVVESGCIWGPERNVQRGGVGRDCRRVMWGEAGLCRGGPSCDINDFLTRLGASSPTSPASISYMYI